MRHKSILILAGGTGGHVYPAIAVAGYLQEQGISIYWLGTSGGLEARVVPGKGYEFHSINVSGIRGKGFSNWLTVPYMMIKAIIQSIAIIRSIRPIAVLGMGGFVSGPGGVAAWLLGIPLFIHEQNSVAGLTNRLLSPLAEYVMEGFPNTFKSNKHVKTTGNPVRKELLALPDPEQRQKEHMNSNLRLLVIGGSQGARIFNEKVPAALQFLQEGVDVDIWHQTGGKDHLVTQENYSRIEKSNAFRIEPYIDDMAKAYSWADLVLCRAGALTIAEICVVGIASILVPYKYAVDDHQTENARHLSQHGCAVLLQESEFEPKKLADLLSNFSSAEKRLLEMAKLAKHFARTDATQAVGNICLECFNV